MTALAASRLARGILILGLVGAAGCDQISSIFGGKDEANAKAGTAPGPVQIAKPEVAPGDVLASVNGSPISKADVEIRIEEVKIMAENFGQPWVPLTKEQLEAGLEELVNSELMSQDAVTRGIDRDPTVQQRWEVARRQFFAQEWLRWNKDRLEVPSTEVEAFYEQNKLGFQIPEQRKLRRIVVGSEDQAKQTLSQLLGGADFGSLGGVAMPLWVMRANDLAAAYPTQADAATAGVTSLDPMLENAVFAIDRVNGLSNLVKGSDNKFHIFQLVENRESRQRPMTEVWDQIKAFLTLQKLQKSVDDLRIKATVERHADRLDGIKQ